MNRMMKKWSLGNVLEQAKQGSSGSMGVDVFVSPGARTVPVAAVDVSNCCNASNLVCSAFLRADSARFFIRNARWAFACFVLEVVVLLVGFELLGLVEAAIARIAGVVGGGGRFKEAAIANCCEEERDVFVSPGGGGGEAEGIVLI